MSESEYSRRHRAIFHVAPAALEKVLHLPESSRIVAGDWSEEYGVFTFCVDDPQFSPVKEGVPLPKVSLLITETALPGPVKISGAWLVAE